MKQTTISVTAGRKFPDPRVNFASLYTSVTITAELEPGDNERQSLIELQTRVDQAAEDEKQRVLKQMTSPQPQWSGTGARTKKTADALAERFVDYTQ